MRRRIVTFASSLSLLLFLATVVLWVRSYRCCDLITGARWGRYLSVASCDHRLWITLGRGWPDERLRWWPELVSHQTPLEPAWATRRSWGASPDGLYLPDLSIESGDAALYTPKRRLWSIPPPPEPVVFVTIRFLWPVVIWSTLPLWTLTKFKRRKRNSTACNVCSYNLTGNTSGICPECGNPIPIRETKQGQSRGLLRDVPLPHVA